MLKKIVFLSLGLLVLSGCTPVGKKEESEGKGVKKAKVQDFTGGLREAMKLKMPMKCTFKEGQSETSTYVKGDRMYMETEREGKKGYIISKDNCTYSWSEEEPNKGIKVCYNPDEMEGQEGESDYEVKSGGYQAKGVDWEVNYKCSPSVFSDDKFNLPAEVKFLDTQEMMKGMMDY